MKKIGLWMSSVWIAACTGGPSDDSGLDPTSAGSTSGSSDAGSMSGSVDSGSAETSTGSVDDGDPSTSSDGRTDETDATAGSSDGSTEGSGDDSSDGVGNVCGDGMMGGTEACDDANTDDGDGCSAECTEEAGFNCVGEPSVCDSICGDGVVTIDEDCDDDNMADGDGCTACAIDPGHECVGEPSVCDSICGDGLIAGGEGCDDDNMVDGDGCTACAIDSGFACMGEPSVCLTTCGDGVLTMDETCDDGGIVDGDGCAADCTVELYHRCVGEGPGSCAPIRTLFIPGDGDDETLRTDISVITGGNVDYIDGRIMAPTLMDLEADYDCVYTYSNTSYGDPQALGDALAGFVDGGGNVVLGISTSYVQPIGFEGTAIMAPDYSPATTAISSAEILLPPLDYAGDGMTLIHQGVTAYSTVVVDQGVVLQGTGVQESTYSDGRIGSAYRPDFKVVYLNGAGISFLGFGGGEWPLLIANSCAAGFVQ